MCLFFVEPSVGRHTHLFLNALSKIVGTQSYALKSKSEASPMSSVYEIFKDFFPPSNILSLQLFLQLDGYGTVMR